MSGPRFSVADRFWSKVIRHDPDDCWEWDGNHLATGYARLRGADGRQTGAHRIAYELLVGPIPPGLDIDHLCSNRGCVNPKHLEPVTNRINTLRGRTLAAANLAKTHCPKGHPYSGDNLYISPKGHRSCRICQRGHRQRYNLLLLLEAAGVTT